MRDTAGVESCERNGGGATAKGTVALIEDQPPATLDAVHASDAFDALVVDLLGQLAPGTPCVEDLT